MLHCLTVTQNWVLKLLNAFFNSCQAISALAYHKVGNCYLSEASLYIMAIEGEHTYLHTTVHLNNTHAVNWFQTPHWKVETQFTVCFLFADNLHIPLKTVSDTTHYSRKFDYWNTPAQHKNVLWMWHCLDHQKLISNHRTIIVKLLTTSKVVLSIVLHHANWLAYHCLHCWCPLLYSPHPLGISRVLALQHYWWWIHWWFQVYQILGVVQSEHHLQHWTLRVLVCLQAHHLRLKRLQLSTESLHPHTRRLQMIWAHLRPGHTGMCWSVRITTHLL